MTPVKNSNIKHQNWDDYRFFLATVKEGNFSAAARKLNVSQPTVSRRIAQMEDNLGLRLFDQQPEGYVLTSEGKALVEIAERLREHAFELQRRATSLQTKHAGIVNLTLTEGLAQYWLVRHVSEFQSLYPKIQVNILAQNEVLDLLRNEADVALRFGDPVSRELVGRRIGAVPFCLFASQDYIKIKGKPKNIEDLKSHNFIGTFGVAARFTKNLELISFIENDICQFSTDNLSVQLALAQTGLGIACLPCYMAQNANLEKIFPDQFFHTSDLWLLSHKDIRKTPRVRALLDFLFDNLRNDLNDQII